MQRFRYIRVSLTSVKVSTLNCHDSWGWVTWSRPPLVSREPIIDFHFVLHFLETGFKQASRPHLLLKWTTALPFKVHNQLIDFVFVSSSMLFVSLWIDILFLQRVQLRSLLKYWRSGLSSSSSSSEIMKTYLHPCSTQLLCFIFIYVGWIQNPITDNEKPVRHRKQHTWPSIYSIGGDLTAPAALLWSSKRRFLNMWIITW